MRVFYAPLTGLTVQSFITTMHAVIMEVIVGVVVSLLAEDALRAQHLNGLAGREADCASD